MTKTTILLIVYIAMILKNVCFKWYDTWTDTPNISSDILAGIYAFVVCTIKPTIICGLILYFF